MRGGRWSSIPRLYAIVDADAIAARGGEPSRAAERLAAAGVGWIQLRAKAMADDRRWAIASAAVDAVARHGASLWINDRPDLAFAVAAAGVHLGQDDLPAGRARELLGDRPWIGASTHDRDQVTAAAADPAVDLIAVGPVYATVSKADAEAVVGLELIEWAAAHAGKPIVGIGGIDAASAPRVLEAGASSVAVMGAVTVPDVERAAGELLRAVDG